MLIFETIWDIYKSTTLSDEEKARAAITSAYYRERRKEKGSETIYLLNKEILILKVSLKYIVSENKNEKIVYIYRFNQTGLNKNFINVAK
jgi:hypothetical protein